MHLPSLLAPNRRIKNRLPIINNIRRPAHRRANNYSRAYLLEQEILIRVDDLLVIRVGISREERLAGP